MLKTVRKSLLVAGLLLCLAGMSMAVYASFQVYSNVVGPVTIDYVLTLDNSSYPIFNATLTNNSVPVSGATINFLYYQNGIGAPAPTSTSLGWISWDNETTDLSGMATSVPFNVTTNGYDYYFMASYTVP